eukprot:scaffold73173_cov33-Phaeocystis_antarctica.AAC.2
MNNINQAHAIGSIAIGSKAIRFRDAGSLSHLPAFLLYQAHAIVNGLIRMVTPPRSWLGIRVRVRVRVRVRGRGRGRVRVRVRVIIRM